MNETKIIKELDVVIAMADTSMQYAAQLKDKATRLRKKLEPVQAPASARGHKGLTAQQEAQILLKRNKRLKIPV